MITIVDAFIADGKPVIFHHSSKPDLMKSVDSRYINCTALYSIAQPHEMLREHIVTLSPSVNLSHDSHGGLEGAVFALVLGKYGHVSLQWQLNQFTFRTKSLYENISRLLPRGKARSLARHTFILH